MAREIHWKVNDMKVAQEYVLPRNGTGGLKHFQVAFERLVDNVSSVVVTDPHNIRLALLGLFAEGHLLLEDVASWRSCWPDLPKSAGSICPMPSFGEY